MSRAPRHTRLLEKAEAALLAAVEVYNRPSFAYREETFSILALNAWELLLKARTLELNGNDIRSVYVYERRKTKSGEWSAKQYLRRNRAGNVHTLGLGQVIAKLNEDASSRLPEAVRANLEALMEIRDNAVHFVNVGPSLGKQVLEIGTASVKNFIEVSQRWFKYDMSHLHLYLMPIGFVQAPGIATAVRGSSDEDKLVRFLRELIAQNPGNDTPGLHTALEVNLSFRRSSADAAAAVAVTTDPNAPTVQISEEDIRQAFPWDYGDLIERLRQRYTDFKANGRFHQVREPLTRDKRYVRTRYLDPDKRESTKKDFYNPNIVREFDRHYTRK